MTSLDDYGEGRNHDLVVLGTAGGKRVLVGIEAKSDEEFGPLIGEYLARVEAENDDRRLRGATRLSQVPERIQGLAHTVFLANPDDFSSLRYQLLHGLVGTLIEAQRRGADTAAFLVHEFLSDEVNQEKVRRNEDDFWRFVEALKAPAPTLRSEGLVGPFTAFGAEGKLRYFVGLVKTTLNSVSPKNKQRQDRGAPYGVT